MISAAFVLATICLQPRPPQPPAPTPTKLPTGACTLVKASGDLDSDHFLRTIFAELDRARGVSLIILELDGNRARPDLVARLGDRLDSNIPPVAVLLRDTSDKKVGIGQALLGGFVKHCFIDEATRIASTPEDDIRYLAPSDTKWELVEQQATGPLWRKLTDLNADQSLPQILLSPSRDNWAVPVTPGTPWKLSPISPAGGQSGPQPRQIAWGDTARTEIDAEAAIGLRLCADRAASPAPILVASGLSPRSTTSKRSIKSDYPDAAESIERTVEDARLAVRRIASTVSIRPSRAVPTTEDYRRAGNNALIQIDRVVRELDRADSLLSDFPELNRRRNGPSSRSDKGPWRPAMDAIRKDLDTYRTTARDLSSR
jgi:hypothetical protein